MARDAIRQLEALGRAGLTISICCGPSGAAACRWSVMVMNRAGEQLDLPVAAQSFTHAVEIAEAEIVTRGWL